jgi:hypothetical protein
VTTDTNGSVTATSGHFPFGENWYETGGTNKLKFTSDKRDAESGIAMRSRTPFVSEDVWSFCASCGRVGGYARFILVESARSSEKKRIPSHPYNPKGGPPLGVKFTSGCIAGMVSSRHAG